MLRVARQHRVERVLVVADELRPAAEPAGEVVEADDPPKRVEAAEVGPQGRLPDLGGPTVYDVKDLARSVATALGRSRRVIGVNIPGLVGAAFRAGGNLTPNRDETGATWNDFVAARIGSSQA